MKRRRSLIALVAAGSFVLAACTGAGKPTEQATDVSAGGGTEPEATAGVEGEALPADGAAGTSDANPSAATGTGTRKPTAGAGATTNATTPGGAPAPTSGATQLPPTQTTLFAANEDRIGITKDKLVLCAHAALTYGAAFNTGVDDLKVYFDAINAEQGGIYGRKVEITYENDDYKPEPAVQAATTCQAKNPFMLLGGIGFDQIPAVRNWAESNRMLYLHHTATVNGAAGKEFSFSPLPSTEKMGEIFGELAASRFKGKRIGIIKRNSPNWEPGVAAFKAIAAKHGVQVVAEVGVEASKGNYLPELLAMQNAQADVVFAWENALAATEMIVQSKRQSQDFEWLLFPFNLTSQTLDRDALNPKLTGIAMFTAYSYGDKGGTFAPYADDITEFERQYAKFRPSADLDGLAGDLLFLNWTAMKALHLQLLDCGQDCTRNRFIDVMKTYKKKPMSSACEIDFTRGGGHLGGWAVNVMETYDAPGDKVNWRNTDSCVEHLL